MDFVCSSGTEKSRACGDAEDKKLHRALASCLISAGLPPQSAAGRGLRGFTRSLNPNFQINVNAIKPLYFEIYQEQKGKIKEILRNYDGKIMLSIDLFDVEYMCVTAHYVDDGWKMKSWVLFCRSVCEPDGPGLTESVLKCISEFDIEAKIFAITTGTCDDFDEAFPIIKDAIQQKKKLALDGQLFRVTCCAGMLSSMVQNAFEKIDDIMDKLHLLYSPGRSEPVWNVTLGYLETVLKLEAKGEYNSDKKYLAGYEVPSSAEWDKARGVYKLVNIIYKAACVMFETKHATSNVYLHLLREVQEALTRESTNPDKFVAGLATKMVKRVNAYCKDMSMVLAVTTVMDPRFKMKYIEFSCSKYGGSSTSEGCSEATVVLEAICKLFNDYVTEPENPFESDSSSCDNMEEGDSEEEDPDKEYMKKEEAKIQEKCREYYNGFSLFKEYSLQVESETDAGKSELDCYLEEPLMAWKQDFNVIRWWGASTSKYPTLSKMARDILAIQMTVATSYANYYTQFRPIEARLKSTSPELMNAIMCAKSWMGKGRKEN